MKRADVVVAGCGVIGLSIAWRLADAGHHVVACDPYPGSGASFAAAGMLSPVAEAAYGEEALLALNVRAAGLWPDFARDLEQASGQEIGYEQAGTMLVGCESGDVALLRNLHRFQGDLGLESSWCTSKQCRLLEPALSASVVAGVHAPLDGRVDNRRLLAALVAACRRAGVVVREQRVESLLHARGSVRGVVVGGEELKSDAVVVASGHRLSYLELALASELFPIRPVKGQILRLATRDGDPLLERTVHAFVEHRSVYLVPRGDGRLVVGATVEERGEDVVVSAGGVYGLLRDALVVLPGLDEAELVEATARLRPGSPDNAPLIGPVPGYDGLVAATGHYRNGLLLAPLSADIVTTVLATGALPTFAERFGAARFAKVATQ